MESLGYKIMFIFVIFLGSSSFGLCPVLFGKILNKKISISLHTKVKLLSYASCFGAGVFLYVCFLGLLPETTEKFVKILKEVEELGPQWKQFAQFPWPFFIVVCGFLFIFTIDKVVHAIEDSKLAAEEYKLSQRPVGKRSSKVQSLPLGSSAFEDGNLKDFEIANGCNGSLMPQPVRVKKLSLASYRSSISSSRSRCLADHVASGHGVPSSLTILIALCMHAIFEGMAVGLQTSSDKVISFAVAIIIHETVMALTFGITVAKGNIPRCKKIVYVLTFAAAVPSGIAIGIAMMNTDTDVSFIVSAIFEAFAPGIFLHVIFIEIIGGEFLDSDNHNHLDGMEVKPPSAKAAVWDTLKKIIAIVAGFTLIIGITLLTPHPE